MKPEKVIQLRAEAQAQAEEYDIEIEKCDRKIKEAERKKQQLLNRRQRDRCTQKKEERAERNHRLILWGVQLESQFAKRGISENGKNITVEEINEFLEIALNSPKGQEWLSARS